MEKSKKYIVNINQLEVSDTIRNFLITLQVHVFSDRRSIRLNLRRWCGTNCCPSNDAELWSLALGWHHYITFQGKKSNCYGAMYVKKKLSINTINIHFKSIQVVSMFVNLKRPRSKSEWLEKACNHKALYLVYFVLVFAFQAQSFKHVPWGIQAQLASSWRLLIWRQNDRRLICECHM